MTEIQFTAYDYHSDDSFQVSEYRFEGSEETGWKITRNGAPYLDLEPGYLLLKTRACGICSTDIDRRFLPFPLPQVTGHEVIAEDPLTGMKYVVEINDTYEARGSEKTDAFIQGGIPTHSPDRMVLGIDRLPGGFGPYLLAPKNAIVPYLGLPDRTAVLVEPFAAALQAVLASPPEEGDVVAVLGPRRLGSLIIAALNAYRLDSKKNFQIHALARRQPLLELAKDLGADEGVLVADPESITANRKRYDIVYDTSATAQGFLNALQLARREVHLKTTNGQKMGGLSHLTELVVDELSILPFTHENLEFCWEGETRVNKEILVTPSLANDENFEELLDYIRETLGFGIRIHTADPATAQKILGSMEFQDRIPRFDLAIVSNLEEVDAMIRPNAGREESLVRPRGAILILPDLDEVEATEDPAARALLDFFTEEGSIRSSRCGDFRRALKLLQDHPSVAQALADRMVSHEFPASDLPSAFRIAQTPEAIKVMVKYA